MADKTDELRDLFEEVTGEEEVVEEQEVDERRRSEEEAGQESDRALPTIEEPCPECDNDMAYYYLEQIRAADESETRFFICTECDHKWRDDD